MVDLKPEKKEDDWTNVQNENFMNLLFWNGA